MSTQVGYIYDHLVLLKTILEEEENFPVPGDRGGGREVLWTWSPTVFVQRCNGSTVGLGYLEVSVDCLLGGSHVRTVNTDWGEWRNSSADFNLNHNHQNTALKH